MTAPPNLPAPRDWQPGHGQARLPAVLLDTYNAELRDAEGFIGDRASMRAFAAMLDDERQRVQQQAGDDPLEDSGERPSKQALDQVLRDGDPEAAELVLGTVESFAQEFAGVIRRFLRLPDWKDTQRIAVGGGMRDSRTGELAIGRTSVLLKGEGLDLHLVPIRHHPDEAGLVGATQLAPPPVFQGFDAILAIDIGGTNIRAGSVLLKQDTAPDLSAAAVAHIDVWQHCDDAPTRDAAVERMVAMLRGLVQRTQADGHRLAPFVGIGCPGLIRADGTIERGGQNLPGNWEEGGFNLPQTLQAALPPIAERHPLVLMHNDAVVQGLSEVPRMADVKRWGVLTIGTGLGNARFTNTRTRRDI